MPTMEKTGEIKVSLQWQSISSAWIPLFNVLESYLHNSFNKMEKDWQ